MLCRPQHLRLGAAIAIVLLLVLAGCRPAPAGPPPSPTSTATPEPLSAVRLVPLVEGLDNPVTLTHAGDERLFVIEQAGLVRIIENGRLRPAPFLDIRDNVGYQGDTWDEQGFLGLAFHPHYQETAHSGHGRFFLYHTNNDGDTVLVRYQVDAADPNRADAASAAILLTIPQPFPRHNAGQLQFGPDGYLYVSVGDGGNVGDPQNNAQDPANLLGTILRLDVDRSENEPYAIPPDNPFRDDPARRDEIWAYGLRNPWRFSFDRAGGDLFIADVGQDTWEEVNWQAAETAGGANYGWRVMEGPVCYDAASCQRDGLTPPIHAYNHRNGCAVVGGFVYRGERFPRLHGRYLFSDFCQGTIWSLHRNALDEWEKETLFQDDVWIGSFGEDVNGEIYAVDNIFGIVYQIRP
jgi:glucose/arabinose dehydrogenase